LGGEILQSMRGDFKEKGKWRARREREMQKDCWKNGSERRALQSGSAIEQSDVMWENGHFRALKEKLCQKRQEVGMGGG